MHLMKLNNKGIHYKHGSENQTLKDSNKKKRTVSRFQYKITVYMFKGIVDQNYLIKTAVCIAAFVLQNSSNILLLSIVPDCGLNMLRKMCLHQLN